MAWYAASLLLFGCLAAAFATGMPAAFSFFAINIVGAYQYLGGDAGLGQLVRNGVASITNFSLTPIPFFILMGEVLFHTGVAMKAIDAIERLIRRVPGRLAVVAVVAGTVFSAISGSTIATTAMLGSLMLPEMLRRGYHPNMAMGPIMAIGGVDMLIPPSALTVLLGSLAGISISHLLVAGILPGLLLAAIFVVYIIVRAKANPALAPAFEEEEKKESGWQRWRPLVVYVVPLTLIFAVVIGAMSAGWATPTESAALGATATVAVAALYRSLKLSSLMKALLGTAAISGVILFIIVGATTFAQILAFSGATNGLVAAVRDASFGTGERSSRNDADPAGARLLHRSGEHDAAYAALLHALGSALRLRPDLVRRAVSDRDAARVVDPAVRTAAVHHEERGPEAHHHRSGLSCRLPVCGLRPVDARHRHVVAAARHLAAQTAARERDRAQALPIASTARWRRFTYRRLLSASALRWSRVWEMQSRPPQAEPMCS